MLLTKCGAMFTDGVATDIGVDETTGEVVIVDDVTGPCFLSEISVLGPIEATDMALLNIAKQLNAEGVFLCEGFIVTVNVPMNTSDYVVEFRKNTDPMTVVKKVISDISELVEEDIEF